MRQLLRFAFAALAAATLSACVETTDTADTGATYFVSDPNSVEVQACRAAIAQATGLSPADVDVFHAPGSEAGTRVLATVATSTEPWTCLADSRGNVSDVRFTGSEGSL